MAGRGPAPKPSRLRARTNKKPGARTLEAQEAGVRADIPAIPNPDARVWHPLTLVAWREWWESEMASEWLQTDVVGLGMLAVLYDQFYQTGHVDYVKEIRLQRQCFGLTPLDRSRLQWEVGKGEEASRKRERAQTPSARRTGTHDPRKILMMAPKAKR